MLLSKLVKYLVPFPFPSGTPGWVGTLDGAFKYNIKHQAMNEVLKPDVYRNGEYIGDHMLRISLGVGPSMHLSMLQGSIGYISFSYGSKGFKFVILTRIRDMQNYEAFYIPWTRK